MSRFEALARRRKTTYEFSDRKVTDKQIRRLIECARWAPSAGNSQPWYFIVVRNKKRIASLMETTIYGAFHNNPPCLIAIVLDRDRFVESEFRFVKDGKVGIVEGLLSAANAALQIALLAEDLNLSSALLTPESAKAHDILDTRDMDFCPIMIGIGYSKQGAFQKERTRLPVKKILFYEKHGGNR